jgi:hypothetical protein
LCPYPKFAKYKGSGSIEDAANFSCHGMDARVATKADISQLEATLLEWFIGTAIAMVGLAFAAAKPIH